MYGHIDAQWTERGICDNEDIRFLYLYKVQQVLCTVLHNVCAVDTEEGSVHNVLLKETR